MKTTQLDNFGGDRISTAFSFLFDSLPNLNYDPLVHCGENGIDVNLLFLLLLRKAGFAATLLVLVGDFSLSLETFPVRSRARTIKEPEARWRLNWKH